MSQAPDIPAITAKDLAYHYGERQALKGVNFSVQRGATHAFLGPNGSGKSTLFKMLATILPPKSGSATVLGLDLDKDLAALRRKLGVVFQAPALDRKISVRQNLIYGGHLQGLSGAALAQKVDALMAQTGLSDRARDKVETLSGGLKRRVELCKGLLGSPEILLLDEPTTGLDPGARRDLWQFLKSQEGLTVLVTTHLMDEAELADQITILHQGEVVAQGTPTELKEGLGEEVLDLVCAEPEGLKAEIESAFGCEVMLLSDGLRIQGADTRKLVAPLLDEFGARIDKLSVAHPSLEDVYIQKTGHRFWQAEQEAEA